MKLIKSISCKDEGEIKTDTKGTNDAIDKISKKEPKKTKIIKVKNQIRSFLFDCDRQKNKLLII